jgi:hypothetical protein
MVPADSHVSMHLFLSVLRGIGAEVLPQFQIGKLSNPSLGEWPAPPSQTLQGCSLQKTHSPSIFLALQKDSMLVQGKQK